MIVTFTANPSVDATLSLESPFKRGEVQRPICAHRSAGGKGVNVANALHRGGVSTIALFPASAHDPFVALTQAAGIPFRNISVESAVRTNTAVTEPDGTTTKLNEPGATLNNVNLKELEELLVSFAPQATAIVLSGSLPPGAPIDWYATLVGKCNEANPKAFTAVDTSDEPLKALAEQLHKCAPTLLKPNGFELGQLTGFDGETIECEAAHGNWRPAIKAAHPLLDAGVQEILLTLGSAGAVLITADKAWQATPPPTQVVSTVGAGDCSLAGYLRARTSGEDQPTALRWAVAYGSAAAGLPGTEIPGPELANFSETTVHTMSTLT
ncbi:1-phosphofructokinase family hexose kinase [Corynebacterium cystitidis]|uniref:1-phosphofructokinase family hexose kinase n=1 Tax=Corynebacterium cystitidis TaxID=35757 RepID=UPI00211E92B4|nr:1-phosphofructokinase family hexose kinase [Corynebacterium cystitidis]